MAPPGSHSGVCESSASDFERFREVSGSKDGALSLGRALPLVKYAEKVRSWSECTSFAWDRVVPADVWGTPMVVDCRRKQVRSAGPDRALCTLDDIWVEFPRPLTGVRYAPTADPFYQ